MGNEVEVGYGSVLWLLMVEREEDWRLSHQVRKRWDSCSWHPEWSPPLSFFDARQKARTSPEPMMNIPPTGLRERKRDRRRRRRRKKKKEKKKRMNKWLGCAVIITYFLEGSKPGLIGTGFDKSISLFKPSLKRSQMITFCIPICTWKPSPWTWLKKDLPIGWLQPEKIIIIYIQMGRVPSHNHDSRRKKKTTQEILQKPADHLPKH